MSEAYRYFRKSAILETLIDLSDSLHIESTELIPLSHKHQSVAAVAASYSFAATERQATFLSLPTWPQDLRNYNRATRDQTSNNITERASAHVVGFGLKRQPSTATALSCEFTANHFSILGIIDNRCNRLTSMTVSRCE